MRPSCVLSGCSLCVWNRQGSRHAVPQLAARGHGRADAGERLVARGRGRKGGRVFYFENYCLCFRYRYAIDNGDDTLAHVGSGGDGDHCLANRNAQRQLIGALSVFDHQPAILHRPRCNAGK